jgi:CRP/FNR family transcriptional regulator
MLFFEPMGVVDSNQLVASGIEVAVQESSCTAVNLAKLRLACSNCNLRELCLPLGLSTDELAKVEQLVATRRKIRRGDALFRAGDRFESLYALRLGFLKSTVMSRDGREQVTGFHMAGELVGLEGIGAQTHHCETVALEDTEVCVIPYDRIEEVSAAVPALTSHFHKVMSREIVQDHGVMLLLGSMHTEERLAAFLLNLSQRFEARGYSRSEFVLRMTRAEIGSFLGLKLETVSRTLSRFAHDGLIEVNQKHLRITDQDGLRAIMSGQGAPGLAASSMSTVAVRPLIRSVGAHRHRRGLRCASCRPRSPRASCRRQWSDRRPEPVAIARKRSPRQTLQARAPAPPIAR